MQLRTLSTIVGLLLVAVTGISCRSSAPGSSATLSPPMDSATVEASSQSPASTSAQMRRGPLRIPPLPRGRHGHRAHFIEGTVVVFGGFSPSGNDRGTRDTLTWRTGQQEWQTRAPLNRGKAFFSSVVWGGTIHALGENVERYDLKEDRWVEVAESAACPKSHFAAGLVGARVYTIGGLPAERGAARAIDLDGGKLGTLEVPTLPGYEPGDHFEFVANLAGRLHVLGGYKSGAGNSTDDHWVLHDGKWLEAAKLPHADAAKFSYWGTYDGRLFVFSMENAHSYDPRIDTWRALTPPPTIRAMAGTFTHDGRLYVIGGYPRESNQAIMVYDIDSDSWANATASSAGQGQQGTHARDTTTRER